MEAGFDLKGSVVLEFARTVTVALYRRYSSDNQDAASIADQFRQAKRRTAGDRQGAAGNSRSNQGRCDGAGDHAGALASKMT